MNSSRKSEFGDSGHCRISTSDVSKIAADRPLSKMRQCANDLNGRLDFCEADAEWIKSTGGFEQSRKIGVHSG
jgi:hypothetical protein